MLELNPSWSPDGKWIAYTQTRSAPDGPGARVSIWIVSSEGGSPKQLSSDADRVEEAELRWSPDGSKLAYTTIQKAWVIPASGGEPREIPVGYDGRITQIDWSPDGQTLAFSGSVGGEEEGWLMSDFLHLVKTGR